MLFRDVLISAESLKVCNTLMENCRKMCFDKNMSRCIFALIEYNMKNVFLERLYIKYDGKLVPDSFKKSKAQPLVCQRTLKHLTELVIKQS